MPGFCLLCIMFHLESLILVHLLLLRSFRDHAISCFACFLFFFVDKTTRFLWLLLMPELLSE